LIPFWGNAKKNGIVKLLLIEASETCTKRQNFTSAVVRNSGISNAMRAPCNKKHQINYQYGNFLLSLSVD
jgi:hypothetical protein